MLKEDNVLALWEAEADTSLTDEDGYTALDHSNENFCEESDYKYSAKEIDRILNMR